MLTSTKVHIEAVKRVKPSYGSSEVYHLSDDHYLWLQRCLAMGFVLAEAPKSIDAPFKAIARAHGEPYASIAYLHKGTAIEAVVEMDMAHCKPLDLVQQARAIQLAEAYHGTASATGSNITCSVPTEFAVSVAERLIRIGKRRCCTDVQPDNITTDLEAYIAVARILPWELNAAIASPKSLPDFEEAVSRWCKRIALMLLGAAKTRRISIGKQDLGVRFPYARLFALLAGSASAAEVAAYWKELPERTYSVMYAERPNEVDELLHRLMSQWKVIESGAVRLRFNQPRLVALRTAVNQFVGVVKSASVAGVKAA